MRLYIMRHGLAGQHGDPKYPNDAERPLTRPGERRTRQCAIGLRRLGLKPSHVLTSPYTRARQTADIVVAGLHLPAAALRETTALTPGAGADGIFSLLTGLPPQAEALLVGHEPDLSHLIARLLTGDANGLALTMKKAAVCCVELEGPPGAARGTLAWLLHPRHMRALA